MSSGLKIVLIAMSLFVKVRRAIPIALKFSVMSIFSSLFFSILGGIFLILGVFFNYRCFGYFNHLRNISIY